MRAHMHTGTLTEEYEIRLLVDKLKYSADI